MIDKGVLKEILTDYKKVFSARWETEKFKWEAIKHFQDNWDIDADNFGKMFAKATSQTGNLLESSHNFAYKLILEFSEFDAKTVKMMFINLYDESKDIGKRMAQFQSVADDLFEKSNDNPNWLKHFQTLRALSTYLWLIYPDKYYIYMHSRYNTVGEILKSDYVIKGDGSSKSLVDGFKLYDEICEELQSDTELINLFKSHLTDNEYPDPKLKTLTVDIGNYIYMAAENNKKTTDNKSEEIMQNDNVTDKIKTYTDTNFLEEVYMTKEQLGTLTSLLDNKKNLILQGAPGVGKTFAAKRLAYLMIGEKDDRFIEFIQFHQNYSYEDFIMGYKPTDDGFKLKEGVFYRFCKKAITQPDSKFFFIIDEINRGNISKIFGELLMLIENGYRNEEIALAYSDEKFSIPKNLHIIGMMNTADRSLAMIDYALRRRFSFFDVAPAFDSNGFKKYQKEFNNDKLDNLIECIKKLNNAIKEDDSLGNGFCIGHSYFCGRTDFTDKRLEEIIKYDIVPMLKEYWFDDKDKIIKWEKDLLQCVK